MYHESSNKQFSEYSYREITEKQGSLAFWQHHLCLLVPSSNPWHCIYFPGRKREEGPRRMRIS